MPKSKNYTSDKTWERNVYLNQALSYREDFCRKKAYEYAGVYDAEGYPLIEKKGHMHEVGFTVAEVFKMEGAVLTHNHPSGGCLSGQDVKSAEECGLMETRATTANGTTFCLRRINPAKAKRSVASDFSSRYEKAYSDHFDKVVNPAFKKASETLMKQKPVYDPNGNYNEYVDRHNAWATKYNTMAEKYNQQQIRFCSNWLKDHSKQYGWAYREEHR